MPARSFPCGSAAKESTCNAGDLGLVPGLGRPPGEGKGYPFQCSGLENSMDFIVHGVAKSWTQLSNFHSQYDSKFGKLNSSHRTGKGQFSFQSQKRAVLKNWPAMQETWVRSLGWEDPLEEGMAIHSSIFT